MTDAEVCLWRRLRGRQIAGCKFRRQHPFMDYVLDFVCLEKRLVVEVDGGQHFECEQDRLRDKYLQAAGFRVLRFWNNQVLQEIDGVVEAIWAVLQDESSHPLIPSPPHPSP
ncbi:MAG: endonuclease domain-containing protein [Proteobacteria bacterium]|nr:endonuclease domain-containing protein [Pseudomonadota bacterium]